MRRPRLLRLADLAVELGAEPVAEEAQELAARVAEGRFYVACVGQFKRGKSTLLNALVGHEVVPTGFVPVTAVPTVIRFGDKPHARVCMRDASWRDVAMTDLKEYVTEELNPENQREVDGAEVFVPSPLLFSGMCFVDTPGLGSVFTGNTATTQAFIPHIDAALVVVGAETKRPRMGLCQKRNAAGQVALTLRWPASIDNSSRCEARRSSSLVK